MNRKLVAEPITEEAFAPFGRILRRPPSAGRSDYTDSLMNRRDGATPCFRTSLTEPSALPLSTRTMERHEFSSQAFLPVDAGRYLVMVAPKAADGGPDIDGARLFVVDGTTGISYDADVWHHPMTVLDRPATFATVMFNDGGSGDEEFVELPVDIELTI
jgi:ureidoglycolate lyase